MNDNEQVRHLRLIMLIEDEPSAKERSPGQIPERLRHNKMEFEYLIAYFLMSRNLNGIVANIARMDDFGYKHIPRHYEEALLIYMDMTGKRIDLHGRSIRPETIQMYQKFGMAYKQLQYNKAAAAGALAPEFGRSYFYYYVFQRSGVWK